MDGETILATIVMIFVGFGMGTLFYWYGTWALQRKDPMHFWTGSTVDPKTISDITGYNRENAKMWRQYSVPYWISGVLGVLGIFDKRLSYLGIIPVGIACTVGIVWLIVRYRKIEKRYKIQ